MHIEIEDGDGDWDSLVALLAGRVAESPRSPFFFFFFFFFFFSFPHACVLRRRRRLRPCPLGRRRRCEPARPYSQLHHEGAGLLDHGRVVELVHELLSGDVRQSQRAIISVHGAVRHGVPVPAGNSAQQFGAVHRQCRVPATDCGKQREREREREKVVWCETRYIPLLILFLLVVILSWISGDWMDGWMDE